MDGFRVDGVGIGVALAGEPLVSGGQAPPSVQVVALSVSAAIPALSQRHSPSALLEVVPDSGADTR